MALNCVSGDYQFSQHNNITGLFFTEVGSGLILFYLNQMHHVEFYKGLLVQSRQNLPF